MSEISFYRKYRPQNFTNLVGQNVIRDTLMNAFQAGTISHAYLFTGPRGTGKTSAARLVGKTLNCLDIQKDGNPCEKCEICRSAQEGKLIDIIEIDAASNRGIDEIRDLREKIKFSPTQAKKKVYIIDEVHMLTKEAFNALLKTLEEPPDHAHFILATTEIHKVPETIISRCQRFDFKRINEEVIMERLKTIANSEKITAEKEALILIAKSVQGGMRDAIGLFEQLCRGNKLTMEDARNNLGIVQDAVVVNLYDFLKSDSAKEALQLINDLYKSGNDLNQFSRDFLDYLRRKMIDEVSKNNQTAVLEILKIIDYFQFAQFNLKNSSIPQLPLEVAVIKSCLPESPVKVSAKNQKVEEEIKIDLSRVHQPIKNVLNVKQDKPVLTLDQKNIKDNFPRILEHIKTPSVRRSFQEGMISGINGDNVKVKFTSRFHLEKVDSVASKAEISNAFQEIFGIDIKIELEFQEVTIAPNFSKTADERLLDRENIPAKDLNKTTAKALEIFGGEMV